MYINGIKIYVCIDSLHLCMYCVLDMHILGMCRYACTCIVKHAFSVCIMYTCMHLQVYIEVHVHM